MQSGCAAAVAAAVAVVTGDGVGDCATEDGVAESMGMICRVVINSQACLCCGMCGLACVDWHAWTGMRGLACVNWHA